MSKAATLIILMLIGLCLILAYFWVDRSISLDYSRQSEDAANIALRGVEHVLEQEWRGLPEAEVLRRLQAAFPSSPTARPIVEKDGDVVWLDEIPFYIEKGSLKSIGRR
ncbi:Imm58 family immunity protein [Burkholderia multivorans]|uniref:Imm58 family immunity protein n=1 Tax=Burkholderia multivorans TaxID=87883 RepID=UPI00209E6359|nr:immunity protein 58 [Burkholderia multivorans]MCO8609469.1 immunity protein 58 [Burkholderia multivorans]MCO8631355.1 immunity protein 58 [Burkholderia multivorans]MCO8636499.1 immunity protein 58 [Burkholderia multivorans]MCO8648333.1 immunity protein 58 [Burkholderia multivorans]